MTVHNKGYWKSCDGKATCRLHRKKPILYLIKNKQYWTAEVTIFFLTISLTLPQNRFFVHSTETTYRLSPLYSLYCMYSSFLSIHRLAIVRGFLFFKYGIWKRWPCQREGKAYLISRNSFLVTEYLARFRRIQNSKFPLPLPPPPGQKKPNPNQGLESV